MGYLITQRHEVREFNITSPPFYPTHSRVDSANIAPQVIERWRWLCPNFNSRIMTEHHDIDSRTPWAGVWNSMDATLLPLKLRFLCLPFPAATPGNVFCLFLSVSLILWRPIFTLERQALEFCSWNWCGGERKRATVVYSSTHWKRCARCGPFWITVTQLEMFLSCCLRERRGFETES